MQRRQEILLILAQAVAYAGRSSGFDVCLGYTQLSSQLFDLLLQPSRLAFRINRIALFWPAIRANAQPLDAVPSPRLAGSCAGRFANSRSALSPAPRFLCAGREKRALCCACTLAPSASPLSQRPLSLPHSLPPAPAPPHHLLYCSALSWSPSECASGTCHCAHAPPMPMRELLGQHEGGKERERERSYLWSREPP